MSAVVDSTVTWKDTWAAIRADFDRTVKECNGGQRVDRLRYLMHISVPSGYLAVIFRLSHYAYAKGWRRLAAALCLLNQRLCGVVLHPACRIGHGLYIPHPIAVTMCGHGGKNLALYPAVYIAPEIFPGWFADANPTWPRLGDNVRVASYAAVIGDVSIGHDVIVSVQAVIRDHVGDRMSVVVRPNWRQTRRREMDVDEPCESADVPWPE